MTPEEQQAHAWEKKLRDFDPERWNDRPKKIGVAANIARDQAIICGNKLADIVTNMQRQANVRLFNSGRLEIGGKMQDEPQTYATPDEVIAAADKWWETKGLLGDYKGHIREWFYWCMRNGFTLDAMKSADPRSMREWLRRSKNLDSTPELIEGYEERIKELEKALDASERVRENWCETARMYAKDMEHWKKQATDISAAALKRADLRDSSQWQDISTAPKDGTVILLGRTGYQPLYQGHWTKNPDEWWVGMLGISVKPTHWMPLPEPPKESE